MGDDGLPGPLAAGLWLAASLSIVPGADDGTGGVVGASRFCESPILLGDRLGKGGGGGGGMTIATKITQYQTK